MFGRDFLAHKAQDVARTIDALEVQVASVDLRERRSSAASTFESDIRRVVDALRAVGVKRLVAFDLTRADFSDALAVVRVIGTGLATPSTTHRRISPRAGRFALQVAA
jgi:ribosomal protein S12 methylthiotransferase accessory factor YcaO